MDMLIGIKGLLARTCAAASRLAGDRRGVAAVEFAFIAPVLLALYFVTMELTQGIESNKKVSRVGSMVADLVTQQSDLKASELDAIMKIGNAIIYPYNRSTPTIEVTGIWIGEEKDAEPTVQWSRKVVDNVYGNGLEPGTKVSVPDTLKIGGTFLVQVDASLGYRPVITWAAEKKAAIGLAAAFDKIEMDETYYLRPRMTTKIACSDCNPKKK